MNRAGTDYAASQRGFALPIVLCTLVILAVLGSALVGTGRQSTQRARNLLDSAVAEAAADGAVQQAIYGLLDQSGRQWSPDGSTHVLRYGRYLAEVRLGDENDKVNPNFAPVELVQALLVRLGVSPFAATNLATAIADWRTGGGQQPRPMDAKSPEARDPKVLQYVAAGRDYTPPGTAFESFDELGAVLGMTPALLARLQPHLTLYSDTDPDASTSDPVVAAAIGGDARGAGRRNMADGPRAVSIDVIVRGPRGTGFGERVVVRTNALDGIRRYEILLRETNSRKG
jgi:general secretion pathway protein K